MIYICISTDNKWKREHYQSIHNETRLQSDFEDNKMTTQHIDLFDISTE